MKTQSLKTLAEYLEMSFDNGASVLLMQMCAGNCAIYVGDTTKPQDKWKYHGDISADVAAEILSVTHTGSNRIVVEGQKYRFFRRFAHFEDRGATVFSMG